ncbi:uncharacterized protein KY384_002762 [Bacidia gigantensis]|uniref:uncharacterized protein n=1 Tax=Bacidia gigantensis TaxID=2732470 RepID=UPI001D03E77F|nr:uncharacterized protein KY384_002762 [Bacidia gigantensis]KAG8532884.1 hypothetical protein KY384_002762 [Bacidia gigantensis]
MSADLFAALRSVRAAQSGDETAVLINDLPEVDELAAGKRDLEPRGSNKRPLEAVGYRMAYAKCISQWIFVALQGGLIILQESNDEVGRDAEVDHLLELQQIKLFFADSAIQDWIRNNKNLVSRNPEDMLKDCLECDALKEQLKNILNNPVNLFGVDMNLNRAKGTIVSGKKFDYSKFDAAHIDALCEYLEKIEKAYKETAKRVGKALQDFFGRQPGMQAQFQKWAADAWQSWVDQCHDNQPNTLRTDEAAMTGLSKKRKMGDFGQIEGFSRVSDSPDLGNCASMPTLEGGEADV